MKRSTLWTKKGLLSTLLVLILSIVIVSIGTASVTTAQSDPPTVVFLDPPTINGTAIGVNNTVTVNLNIRDGFYISLWGMGMIFNASLLECLNVVEGEFLKSAGTTTWSVGTINNAAGLIEPGYGCNLFAPATKSGSGRLAYLTFRVKAEGVSDLHLRNVNVGEMRDYVLKMVPIHIIDVYTVVLDATPHTVVTVSNTSSSTATYSSGFYNHAFKEALEELSFTVTSPFLLQYQTFFANVTIPDTLLNVSTLDEWKVLIDGIRVSKTVTYNGTHYSIYFTYGFGIHNVQITTRPLISSTISINLSSTTVTLGSNVTISGNVTAEDPVDPVRANVTVTIQYRKSGVLTWDTLEKVTTDPNSNYTYTWTPGTAGTYEFRAKWDGDPDTFPAVSDVKVLTVPKLPSSISINLSPTTVTLGSNITISGGITPSRPNITITIEYISVGGNWTDAAASATRTNENSNYSYTLTPIMIPLRFRHAGTYEFRAKWDGDPDTLGAVSDVKVLTVLKISSSISINLSPTTVTLGSNVTISGNVTAGDTVWPGFTVTIQYRPTDGNWTTLANVTTSFYSDYTYTWTPGTAGTYEFRASWDGDPDTLGAVSDVKTLRARAAESINPYIVVAVVVPIILVVAAIGVYFVKFRKAKP